MYLTKDIAFHFYKTHQMTLFILEKEICNIVTLAIGRLRRLRLTEWVTMYGHDYINHGLGLLRIQILVHFCEFNPLHVRFYEGLLTSTDSFLLVIKVCLLYLRLNT